MDQEEWNRMILVNSSSFQNPRSVAKCRKEGFAVVIVFSITVLTDIFWLQIRRPLSYLTLQSRPLFAVVCQIRELALNITITIKGLINCQITAKGRS